MMDVFTEDIMIYDVEYLDHCIIHLEAVISTKDIIYRIK